MSRIVRAGNTIVTYTTTTTTSTSKSRYEIPCYKTEAHKSFDENVFAKLSGKTGKIDLRDNGPALVVWSIDGIIQEIQRQVVKFKCRLIDIFQVCDHFSPLGAFVHSFVCTTSLGLRQNKEWCHLAGELLACVWTIANQNSRDSENSIG